MSTYRLTVLSYEDCPVKMSADQLVTLLKAWRKQHAFAHECSQCQKPLLFDQAAYTCCCQQFYYDSRLKCYPVQSIAVQTPGFEFLLPQLKLKLQQNRLVTNQEFIVLPDPIYWQVAATLVYEKVMKFVSGLPVTNQTREIQPASKRHVFYKQIQEAPLNYGSLNRRSCGKATLIRQVAFGKRCVRSMRGMIVPDASLEPNEIRIPDRIVREFDLVGKWIILNRMPSLQPGNFVALRVSLASWPYDCFGIPLEIVESMNADFDGDECNLYLVHNLQSQAECATILNSQMEMGCFVMGLKLEPSQDMLVAYHLYYDDIHFLPYKDRDLRCTFRVIYDLYGSHVTYDCFNKMRQFYLDVLQKRTFFGLTLAEMNYLVESGRQPLETFKKQVGQSHGCLVTQVKSGAKGSLEHLYQMFGKMGYQNNYYVENSLWEGLNPVQAVEHATETINALSQSGKIWEPGYGYSKTVFNLQGLRVDNKGRWVDGERNGGCVVEKDVLNVVHYTTVMSEAAFRHLVQKVLVEN